MAHDEHADDQFAPLPAGAQISDYRVVRVVSAAPERNLYVIQLPPEEDRPSPANEPGYLLIEGPAESLSDAMTVAALQLRHPRLLALRATFVENGREYLVSDLVGNDWPPPPHPTLVTEEVLAVGVMIGEVLAFLHGRGVAHQQVIPANLVITAQGIFLAGLEQAMLVQSAGAEADALFARDANFLAQAIGQLVTAESSDSPPTQALHRIVQRGAEGAYNTVRELLLDLLQVLPDGLPRLSPTAATAPMRLLSG